MEQDNMKPRWRYQEYMFQKILQRGKVAVIGKPGCGKTRPIIDAQVEQGNIVKKWLGCDFLEIDGEIVNIPAKVFPNGSIFVMCSGPAIATWYRQFPEWVGKVGLKDHIHVITGEIHKSKTARLNAWKQAISTPGIYITNFACFRLDYHVIRQLRWAAVIVDEYHKVMRRRQSNTFKYFRSWTKHRKDVILASGSVWSKEPGSMWTAFVICEPTLKLFRSYWRYVKTFCIVADGEYGQEIVGTRNVSRLKLLMDKYFAYIPEKVIADQQPEGRRNAINAIMTKEQKRIYDELTEDMVAFLGNGELIVASTPVGMYLKMRQLLCCPKILDESLGMGAGYETILDRLVDQPHAMIFVPFRLGVTHIVKALKDKGYSAEGMMGGIGHVEQQAILERFRINRGIIVCTIAYAESFDAETCDTSYFLGYDFNVDPNQQAEGRTQRGISEHKFVTWNYIKHVGTYDEIMLMNLDEDMMNVSRVLSRPEAMINTLKGITT